ncbi:MAG: YeeE/YedE thiosulfate transporter family protein [Rhodothalassiaceae bacterium]
MPAKQDLTVTSVLWLLPALVFALILGFATNRGGICMVRAFEELRCGLGWPRLFGFAKTAAWVMLAVSLWAMGTERAPVMESWALTGLGLVGGLLFGLGAAINQACAMGTLGALGQGQMGMSLTLAGLGLGAALMVTVRAVLPIPAPVTAVPLIPPHSSAMALVVLLLCVWAVLDLRHLRRCHEIPSSLGTALHQRPYGFSFAALLIGLSNAAMSTLIGQWAYTGTIADSAAAIAHSAPLPAARWALFAAAIVGSVLAAMASGSVRLAWRPRLAWLRHLLGGMLMAVGVSLAPGGNDELMLHAIPGLSPHGLPVFAAMAAGIWAGLAMLGQRPIHRHRD